jgi:hypothetical protein
VVVVRVFFVFTVHCVTVLRFLTTLARTLGHLSMPLRAGQHETPSKKMTIFLLNHQLRDFGYSRC